MGWFGPDKDEVWERLSRDIGGQYIAGSFWKSGKVQKRVDQWTITLDTVSRQQGENNHATYTRLRAPYANPDGFRFTVYQSSFFSGLGRALGMQDVEIGDPAFDDAFIVKGNDESKLVSLFADRELREMVASLPRMRLEVKGRGSWFSSTDSPNVDLLCFETPGVVKDLDKLEHFFAVLSALLHRLCTIGVAHKYDPGVRL